MIRALNGLRKELGLPQVVTLTGSRRASRKARKALWAKVRRWSLPPSGPSTMERYRNLMAGEDIGESDAEARGRLARMGAAVRAGCEAGVYARPRETRPNFLAAIWTDMGGGI